MKPQTSIQYIKGIGEARAKLFGKLGINTVGDLLFHFPRQLEDRREIKAISDLMDGETVCVSGSLASEIKSYRKGRRMSITRVMVSDGSDLLQLSWFNAPYISATLQRGAEFTFYGKVIFRGRYFEMVNPVVEEASSIMTKTGKILPVYPSTAGLSQTHIRNAVLSALSSLEGTLPDIIPEQIRKRYGFKNVMEALSDIHNPKTFEDFESARQRFAFEEFLVLQCGIRLLGNERRNYYATPIKNVKRIKDFAEKLPFDLTKAQKRVINEISADIQKSTPMNRLIQGDVGSGKTIVAAAAMYAVAENGYQAVLMAPTEILASQHFKNLKALFSQFGFETVLLHSGMPAPEKREAKKKIADGTAQIIIGTHALISKGVTFKNAALVITDEQHRFGVRQRLSLTEKGLGAHTLVMTATPIPRTLSLILYGDLDISVIDELPPGRKPIETYSVGEKMRNRIFAFLRDNIAQGRQAYIVCPLIEESEALSAKSAIEYAEKLQSDVFPNLKIEVMHGKLKSTDRQDIMNRFSKGEIDILVSTTVIEVGVDVPNASIMIIENAERFGLSQLHQLRGRIGRGEHSSYCIMFSGGGDIAKERMAIMCKTSDGFKISEKDLELRGPGEFFGIRQHGLPELKVSNLSTDMNFLSIAKTVADELLAEDKILSHPQNEALSKQILKRFAEVSENGILN
ncbi:MAG: ATP-dependent DNA helicase RecG [Clostridia bacterium]|nr:ATP-dependent DNA helicase RecG [Clostridia bacterium]